MSAEDKERAAVQRVARSLTPTPPVDLSSWADIGSGWIRLADG